MACRPRSVSLCASAAGGSPAWEPSQQPRQAQSVTRPRCGLSTRGFPTPRVVSVQPRPRAQESGFRVPDQGTLGPPETLGKAGVGPEVRISGLLLRADPGGDGAWCSCLVPCVIRPGHAPESWVMESQAKPPPPVLTGSARGALFPLLTCQGCLENCNLLIL